MLEAALGGMFVAVAFRREAYSVAGDMIVIYSAESESSLAGSQHHQTLQ